MDQKRVLAIHDISCVGRCSLTVALPIISATGAECSILPTAVLSTHTGGFTGYTYRDLTEDVRPIENHWKGLGLTFDAVYTGFLGSFEQIDLVCEIFDTLCKNSLKIVDPAMADNGKLYPVFNAVFPSGMRKLCSKADVIMPNITEATLMLEEEYKEGPYTKEYIEGLLKRLSNICNGKIILTGVQFNSDDLGAAAYDCNTGEIFYSFHPIIPGYYHGTGDVFGSVAVGCMVEGLSLARSIEVAVDFTARSILRTKESGRDIKYGVDFERGIPKLIRDIGH